MFEKITTRVIGIVLSDGRIQKVRAVRQENNKKLYDLLPISLGKLDDETTKKIIEAWTEDNNRRFKQNEGNAID